MKTRHYLPLFALTEVLLPLLLILRKAGDPDSNDEDYYSKDAELSELAATEKAEDWKPGEREEAFATPL